MASVLSNISVDTKLRQAGAPDEIIRLAVQMTNDYINARNTNGNIPASFKFGPRGSGAAPYKELNSVYASANAIRNIILKSKASSFGIVKKDMNKKIAPFEDFITQCQYQDTSQDWICALGVPLPYPEKSKGNVCKNYAEGFSVAYSLTKRGPIDRPTPRNATPKNKGLNAVNMLMEKEMTKAIEGNGISRNSDVKNDVKIFNKILEYRLSINKDLDQDTEVDDRLNIIVNRVYDKIDSDPEYAKAYYSACLTMNGLHEYMKRAGINDSELYRRAGKELPPDKVLDGSSPIIEEYMRRN